MILFTIYDLFTKMLYDGDGRKTPKYKNETKEKIPRLVALPPPFDEMEADCFPVVCCTPSDALVDVYLWRWTSPLCREYNTSTQWESTSLTKVC